MLGAGCPSALLAFPSRVVRFVSFCHQAEVIKIKQVWFGLAIVEDLSSQKCISKF